jgi:hypothetical protein
MRYKVWLEDFITINNYTKVILITVEIYVLLVTTLRIFV